MFCVYCGQQVSNGARFCSKCGKPRTPRPDEVPSNVPTSTRKYYRKYDFTGETKTVGEKKHPITVYRIRRSDGVLGGWIQSEENLSHEGNCWVGDNAVVYENAKVEGNAQVLETADVHGQAHIYDDAVLYGSCSVSGTAKVRGNAKLYETCIVFGNANINSGALVHGNASIMEEACISGEVYGEALIADHAVVSESARVYERAEVSDNAKISGNAQVYGKSKISGHAIIKDTAEVFGSSTVSGNAQVLANAKCENSHIEDESGVMDEVWLYYCDVSGYAVVGGDGKVKGRTLDRGKHDEPRCIFNDGVQVF